MCVCPSVCVQSCISEVSSVCNRHLRSASSESVIVLIQSCIRGFLARKHLASSKTFAKSARLAAVKIQVNMSYVVICLVIPVVLLMLYYCDEF